MNKVLRLLPALIFYSLLLGCSDVNVTTPKWTCEKSQQTCNVVFAAINKKNESVSTEIFIRAYDRVNRGKGAISNVLMGKKAIKVILLPSEHFFK